LVLSFFSPGIFFFGPAGYAIPIGVPVIPACGWWMYRMQFSDREEEDAGEPQTLQSLTANQPV